VVTKNSPALTTTVVTSSPVLAPATITDSATLTGATADAGGTVTYKLFVGTGADACAAANLQTMLPPVNVTGGVVPDGTFTGVVAGSYELQAVYSGDANNTGATSDCGTEPFIAAPLVTTTVFDAATKAKWTETETTGASAYDTSTVTGVPDFPLPMGTLTYSLFSGGTCASTDAITTLNGNTWPQDVTLNATTAAVPNSQVTGPLAAGSYSFRAEYLGDQIYTSSTSSCEPFTVAKGSSSTATTVKDPGGNPMTTAPSGSIIHDTTTVTGAAGITPTGIVTYTFFTNATCSGTGSPAGTVTLTAGGGVPDSNAQGPLTAGSYSFRADYTGDNNFAGSTGPCEPFTISAGPPPAPPPPITNVTLAVTG